MAGLLSRQHGESELSFLHSRAEHCCPEAEHVRAGRREGGGGGSAEERCIGGCADVASVLISERLAAYAMNTGSEEHIKMSGPCGSYFCRIMTVVFNGEAAGRKENADSKTK